MSQNLSSLLNPKWYLMRAISYQVSCLNLVSLITRQVPPCLTLSITKAKMTCKSSWILTSGLLRSMASQHRSGSRKAPSRIRFCSNSNSPTRSLNLSLIKVPPKRKTFLRSLLKTLNRSSTHQRRCRSFDVSSKRRTRCQIRN
jgi:hypothetical protein